MTATSTRLSADNVSMRMLSPPLSPSPELATVLGSFKAQTAGNGSASVPTALPDTLFSQAQQRSLKRASHRDLNSDNSQKSPEKRMVTCWDALLSDPVKYYKREMSYLDLYPMSRLSTPSYSAYAESSPESRMRRKIRGSGLRRTLSDNDSGPESVPTRLRASSVPALDRSGDRSTDEERFGKSRSSPKKRSSAAANVVRVHDLNLAQIEDYSPSINLLPPGRSLRAEWKGAPMDLSTDPDAHLLHPAELHLASVLRLPAEVYLDSKRRLFAEKVHRLRQGLAFRRTDSQKACRIDVNKASRLFGAFEKVGWLNDELFSHHL